MEPIRQFDIWYRELLNRKVEEPTAMVLATVSASGRPSTRVVLMKQFDEQGFVFYTNYNSRKGQELLSNPHAALLFYWLVLDRQVRVEGRVVKVSPEESDAYFDSRPFGSRASAAISPQSQVIPGRDYLLTKKQELISQYADEQLKRPDHWGGFRLVPQYFEFWQAGEDRLHHRIIYELKVGKWDKYLLAP